MSATMSAGTLFSKALSMRWPSLVFPILVACRAQHADVPVNTHAREAIGTVREMYDGRLTPQLAVQTFRNIDRLFPSRVIARGATVAPLPVASASLGDIRCRAPRGDVSLDEYMRLDRVTGLLVLKDGRIVLERYAGGNAPDTRWMSMSMAKSITSTLIGVALREGKLRSLDDPVTRYVPSLAGSAYDGVTVRNILTMSSGVRWNEAYTDPSSDRRHLLDAQIAQRPGAALALMATLPRAAAPGSVWNYSTGETLVAGEVVRGAVGTSLSSYLSEKIWKRVGMEHDATWWLDSPDGHEIGGSGIMATLRDYARFGLYILREGVIDGDSTLPRGWVTDAGSAKTLTDGSRSEYGYMWWPMTASAGAGATQQGAFAAEGIFGQWLFLDPSQHIVIVQLSAQTAPSGGDVVSPEGCFAAITAALAGR